MVARHGARVWLGLGTLYVAWGSTATVECRAMQSLPAFAQRFGVSRSSAVGLAGLYRVEVYPDLDDEYHRAGGCPS